MAEVFANSEDPDQMQHSAASDLGLHCLTNTFLRVSRLQWVNQLSNYCSNMCQTACIVPMQCMA